MPVCQLKFMKLLRGMGEEEEVGGGRADRIQSISLATAEQWFAKKIEEKIACLFASFSSQNETVTSVCLCFRPLFLYVYVSDRYVCMFMFQAVTSVDLCLRLYVYVSDHYICMFMFQTITSVCLCFRPLHLYVYVSDHYICMFMFQTVTSVCLCFRRAKIRWSDHFRFYRREYWSDRGHCHGFCNALLL